MKRDDFAGDLKRFIVSVGHKFEAYEVILRSKFEAYFIFIEYYISTNVANFSYYLNLCFRPQIRPNTGFFKQLIKYEERLFGEPSVKMVYCEAIDKEIPDVYEADYVGMTWFRQRYGPIEKC